MEEAEPAHPRSRSSSRPGSREEGLKSPEHQTRIERVENEYNASNAILTRLARQERKVLELRDELAKAEAESQKLRRDWIRVEAARKRPSMDDLFSDSRASALPGPAGQQVPVHRDGGKPLPRLPAQSSAAPERRRDRPASALRVFHERHGNAQERTPSGSVHDILSSEDYRYLDSLDEARRQDVMQRVQAIDYATLWGNYKRRAGAFITTAERKFDSFIEQAAWDLGLGK